MLLTEQWQAKLLDDGLRCEECKATKNVKEQTTVRDLASILVIGFPRGAEVRSGRQMRNRQHRLSLGANFRGARQAVFPCSHCRAPRRYGYGCRQRGISWLGCIRNQLGLKGNKRRGRGRRRTEVAAPCNDVVSTLQPPVKTDMADEEGGRAQVGIGAEDRTMDGIV